MGDSFRMMARVAVCAVAVVLCAAMDARVTARAQTQGSGPVAKTMLLEPPTPLLPATLGKLSRVAEGDAGDGVGSVDAADMAVMTEDGLRRFARSNYAGGAPKGAYSLTVTVYKFVDASGAISAYRLLQEARDEAGEGG